MPTRKLTDQMRAQIEEYLASGVTKNKQTIKRYIRYAKNADPKWYYGLIDKYFVDKINRVEETESEKQYTFTVRERFTNYEDMAKFCKIDLDVWKPVKIVTNDWNTSQYFTCWQFKVTWRRREGFDPVQALNAFKELLGTYKVPAIPKYKKNISQVAYEIDIPDLHLGRLAWEKESGKNWDVKIAYREWLKAHEYFMNIAITKNVSHIVLLLGSDYYNVNNAANTTANNTPQDEDGRWQRSFDYGLRGAVDAIEMWRQHGITVEIFLVPGNHDIERLYYLGAVLSAWYRSIDDVVIHNEPTVRKYFVWGRNLIGFSHGKDDKKELPHIFQSEMRDYLSQCDNVEFHIGHEHQERAVIQQGSVIIRTVPSLAQMNAWETSKGYSGNRRAQAFAYNKERGLMGIDYYTPDHESK